MNSVFFKKLCFSGLTHLKFSLNIIKSCVLFLEPIIDFDWEPNGSKFVVIHGETGRLSASFYNIEEGEIGKVVHLSKWFLIMFFIFDRYREGTLIEDFNIKIFVPNVVI